MHSNKQQSSKKTGKSASSNTSQGQDSGFIIPGRVKPVENLSDKCNSCHEKDATRLCLVCNKICCDGCALDVHEDHKIVKLSKVGENLENEKSKLEKHISEVQNLMTGKEGAAKALKSKEEEIIEQVDFYFENWHKVLENQKQAIKNAIPKMLLDVATESSDQGMEALKWLSSAKSFSVDFEKNKIMDNNSLYCSLYQLTKRFKALDLSKLNSDCGTAALEKSFDQIQIQHNKQLFEVVKRENIVEVKVKESAKKNAQTPSRVEEVRKISSDVEEVSQDSSPIQARPSKKQNAVASDWGQKELPKPTPTSKTDISKELKKAFENKLEIQVKTQNDSILLESISKHNSKNLNVNNGLKNDAHVELFREILATKGLTESCQRVTDLTLDFFNLTEEGIFSLADVIYQLPSLQTVQLSFYMTLGLYPINLKPLFESLSSLKYLTDISLKLPTWTHLKGSAFLPLLSSVSNILTLQSFSLDLSRCSKLDLKGISEALKYLLRHKNLEKLQISFRGCINIDNDRRALENLYQNCLNSTFKGIKLDFSECPNLSSESIDMIDDINKIKPYY